MLLPVDVLLAVVLFLEPALALYVLRPALSIEDCYLALLAKHHDKQPLWTFDKKLVKQSDGLAKEVGTI